MLSRLLAEAGDGSMRDALSILDQAIASTSDHLTLDSVRSLIGSAPAAALETVMQAVAESSSEKILVLVDELIGEGHSPTHFARQLVRFLRNVTVAKIAGKDSPLLQISSDERARVSRIADLFSEEDLDPPFADHAAHARRTRIPPGTALPSGTRLAENGARPAPAADRAVAERCCATSATGTTRPAGSRLTAPAEVRLPEAQAPSAQVPCRRSRPTPRAKAIPKGQISGERGFAGGGAPRHTTGRQCRHHGIGAPAVEELSPELESNPEPGRAYLRSLNGKDPKLRAERTPTLCATPFSTR
jgi:hypothetical protein